MAYDEELAERVREQLASTSDVTEKKMFGGLAFLVGGHMAVAVSGNGGLMVRVDPSEVEALVAEPHVEPMVMGGRRQKRWVRVRDAGIGDDATLGEWIARGVATL